MDAYWIKALITERLLVGHLMCPTCDHSIPGRCCQCETLIDMVDQTLDVDPYAATLEDNDRHLLCRTCLLTSLLEAHAIQT
jgi:hypothetical protein